MADVRMPDGTVIRNVPEGTTKAVLQARLDKQKAQEQFKAYTYRDLATNKVTGGLSDKAVPLANAGIEYLTNLIRPTSITDLVTGNKRKSFGELYQREQADRDKRRADYAASHPGIDWLTLPLNFMIGGPGKLAGAPLTARQIAGVGAQTGLLAGAGNSRGSLTDQIGQTEVSSMAGALAAPVVSKATSYLAGKAGALARAVRTPKPAPAPNVSPSALGIAAKAIADQGMTPAEAGQMIQAGQNRGVPLALMDTGDETRGLVAALARKPGSSRTLVRDVVIPRQEGQLERLQGALTRDIGPTANVTAQSEALMQQAKTAADPLYEQAYQNGGASIFHGEVKDLLSRPSMKVALANARRIAEEEGRDPNALGLVFGKDNVLVKVEKPTWQTFDYIKRGLDDVIESYRDPVSGRLNLDTEGRAINSTLRTFLGKIDKANPDYAAARSAYGGPASMASALRKGSQIVNKGAEDIWTETRDLTPAQLEQYRLGARTALSNMMENRVDTADKVKALVGTPKKREALDYLFGKDGGFENFLSTLGDEKAAAETFGRVATGSQTSANDADLLHLDQSLGGTALKTVGRAATGQGMVANGLLTMRDLARYGFGQHGERVRSELGALLTETGPEVLSEILRSAAEDEARDRLIKLSANAAASKAAPFGAMFGGQIPARTITSLATPSGQ